MNIDYKKTKIVVESLKAYHTILSNKQYRSPDEVKLFTGLTPVLKDIDTEQERLERQDNTEGETYERQPDCEVCD